MSDETISVPRELLERVIESGGYVPRREQLRALLAQPAEQHQGEPVACMPVERCYDVRAQMIIAFNEAKKAGGDLDDALDAAYKSALRYSPNPMMRDEQPGLAVPVFVQTVLAKLGRFQECAFDGQDSDIGRAWFDVLVQLGLLNRVQRSPALWEITDEGIAALEDHAAQPAPVHAVPAQPDAEIPASLFCLPRFDMDQTACEFPDPDGVWVRYDDVAAFLQHQDKPLIHITAEKLAMLRGERKMEPGGLTFSLSEPIGGWTIPLYTRPGAQLDTGTNSDKYKAELYDEVWQLAREMGYGNVTDALMKLKKQSAPTAVVMPPKKRVRPETPTARVKHIKGWNACLDEVARLNPPQQ